jgi:hypothetical protein
MSPSLAALLAAMAWSSPSSGTPAQPAYRVTLEDPHGDDDGPGSYVYPSDNDYPRGCFDLERLEVRREADAVVFEVTLATAVRRPPQVRRTNAQQIDLENGVYVQNVDIYIDTDGDPTTGITEAIPGRNVTLDGATPWDKAVVLTPLPFAVRSMLSDWRPAFRVLVPSNVTTRGATVVARVPVAELGEPQRKWGYAVMITGALWEESFDAVGRLVGSYRKNAFTMPVFTVPEARIIGGADLSNYHPWVMDILTGEGQSQRRILSSYDEKRERLAAVPMVYPFPEAHAEAAAAAPELPKLAPTPPPGVREGEVVLRVRDVQKDMVVLERGPDEVKAFTLGTVLDEEGQAVAQVVVTAVYPKFVLVTAVEGADAIKVGAAVRFIPGRGEK